MTKHNDVDIPPGTYKLARDVQNPTPDRRHTRDWRKMPVWNQGSRFVVKEQRRMGDKHLAEVTAGLDPDVVAELRAKDRYTVVELAGSRWPGSHRIGPGDEEQYAALAAALTPCEESLSQFMTRIDCESGFVEWLVENDKITRADLEKWWHSYQYGDDESDVEPPAVITLPVHDEVPALPPAPVDPTVKMTEISLEGGVGSRWGKRPEGNPGDDPHAGHGGYNWGEITQPGNGEDD